MLPDPVLFVVMGAGLVVGVVAYITASGYRVRTAMVAAVVEKLCLAGNFDRARKLCAAAPDVPYLAVVRQALAVVATPGLRADRGHLRARLQEAWRGEVGRREALARRSLRWDAVAASLLGAALGLALSASPIRPTVAVPSGAALLVLLGSVRRKLAVGGTCRLVESTTLDAMVSGARGTGVEHAAPARAPAAAAPPGLTAADAPAPLPLAPPPPAPADALTPAAVGPAPAADALVPAPDPFAVKGPLPLLGPNTGNRSHG
jgi:hypothetical protein